MNPTLPSKLLHDKGMNLGPLPRIWYCIPLIAFALTELINSVWLKASTQIPFGYYQFLDRNALQHDLFRSILLLHAQPPLMNIACGLILKLAAAVGCSPESVASLVLATLGLATALLLFHLTLRSTGSCFLASLAVVFYFTNPSYVGGSDGVGRNFFFYEYLLQSVVLLAFLACLGWIERATWRSGLLMIFCIATAVNTRTMFHPLYWGLVLVVGMLVPHWRTHRTKVACLACAALCLFSVWSFKNYFVFGAFTPSSWDAWNLDRGFASSPQAFSDFQVSGKAPAPAEALEAFPKIKDWPRSSLEVVTATNKSNGSLNYNNLVLLSTRSEGIRRAIEARKNPRRVLEHAVHMYRHVTQPMYMHPYFYKSFGATSDQFTGYLWLYDRLLNTPVSLGVDSANDPAYWNVFGVFLLPVLAVSVIVYLFRPNRNRVWLAGVAFTAFFPIMAACLSDGFEANRYRHSTYPLMIVLGLTLFCTWYRWLSDRLGHRFPFTAQAAMSRCGLFR